MRERIREIVENLRERWDNLEKRQRIRLIGGFLIILISLGIALYFAFRTEWSILYKNKDAMTLARARTALDEAGIRVKLMDNESSLAVPKKSEFDARVAIESDPEIEGETYFDYESAFDQIGVGVSESVKREIFLVTKQNELAASIKEMFAVNDATVFLNIPERSLISFAEAEPATASIFINQASDIDNAKAQAIADHVAGAIQGLDRQNVTITNQHMEILYSGDSQGGGALSQDYEMELKRKSEIELKVYNLLKPVYDDIKIMSNIVVNINKISQEDHNVIPVSPEVNSGVTVERATSNEQAASEAAGAEPGLNANDNAGTDYQMPDGNAPYSGSRKETTEKFEPSTSTKLTQFGYGELIPASSSLSVIGYRYRTYYQEYMEEYDLLGGLTWDQFKEQQTAAMPVRIDDAALDTDIMNSLSNGTGIGSENISLIAYELYDFRDAEVVPIDWQLIVVFVILTLLLIMLAYGLIKSSEPQEVLAVDPELSVEDLLVSTQLEEAKEEEAERLKEIDYTTESEVKKQIDKFVDDKPEAVAQLLRNWLNEGWE